MLYGKPGLGKTWLGIELAFSVACGAPWYGLPTTAAQTMYLSLELQNWAIQKRLHTLRSHVLGMCVTEEVVPLWESRSQALHGHFRLLTAEDLQGRVNIEQESDFNALVGMCQEFALKLLVVDALSRIHEADENSTKEFGKVLAKLDELRLQTGCAIFLIHHDRKGKSDRGDGGMDAMRDLTPSK